MKYDDDEYVDEDSELKNVARALFAIARAIDRLGLNRIRPGVPGTTESLAIDLRRIADTFESK